MLDPYNSSAMADRAQIENDVGEMWAQLAWVRDYL
jgi:hypothetical protein